MKRLQCVHDKNDTKGRVQNTKKYKGYRLLAKDSRQLRLQNRFDGLEDESMELTCTDPSPENSQPAPSPTRTNNEDGPLTSDQTINDESLGASPSTAHVPGEDIHATLGKKRIRTTEPEISNLDVSEDTEHSVLCFSGKLAGKDAGFLVDSWVNP